MAVAGVGITALLTHKAARKRDPNWKNYIPPVVAGLGTAACIIGANCMHLKIEAALAGAVAFYKAAGEDFEEAVYEKFGDAGLRENLQINPTNVKIRIWEPYTRQWFEATQQEILWAELTANKLLHQSGKVTLNDVLGFYSDQNLKKTKRGSELGWSWDSEEFDEMSSYYYAGGWIDMCPQFDDSMGNCRFVMEYGINPMDISGL